MTEDTTTFDRLCAGDQRLLSRLIRRIEDEPTALRPLLERVWSRRGSCAVLGVTGPPGAGKSTLVDLIIGDLRRRGHRVAVLAVDPSSPWTGGAILGDRVRMQGHTTDRGVFIRSLASRGELGGLSRATLEAAILCAAAGFDRVIVETVGVGQTELDVVSVADHVLVLLVPEAGDVVQALKAGLLEGADTFAVNKADRGGADALVRELRFLSEDALERGRDEVPVFAVSAATGVGMGELLSALSNRLACPRAERSIRLAVDHALRLFGHDLRESALGAARLRLAEGQPLRVALARGERSPYEVARLLRDAP